MRLGSLLSSLALLAVAGAVPVPVSAIDLTPAERAAAFKAAGFKARGAQHVRCEDPGTTSYMPGQIEVADLNGDGRPEVWITEGSTFCYGHTGSAVVLLTKDDKGSWTVLLDEVGMALPLETKQKGWPDIEVGGPGMGPQPVFRFDGKKYTRGR
jgi:hypothetical protein